MNVGALSEVGSLWYVSFLMRFIEFQMFPVMKMCGRDLGE